MLNRIIGTWDNQIIPTSYVAHAEYGSCVDRHCMQKYEILKNKFI